MKKILRACLSYGAFLWILSSIQAQDFDFELMTAEHVSLRGFDIKKLYSGPVQALTFGKDDKQFFSSGVDARIHCWDFYAGVDKERLALPLPEDPNASIPATNVLLYLSSGQLLATGDGGLIHLLDPIKKNSLPLLVKMKI